MSLPSAATGRTRALTAEGQRWIVREVPAPHFDRRGGKHLLFESDGVIRRIRTYPSGWYELDDAQLYALTDRIRITD